MALIGLIGARVLWQREEYGIALAAGKRIAQRLPLYTLWLLPTFAIMHDRAAVLAAVPSSMSSFPCACVSCHGHAKVLLGLRPIETRPPRRAGSSGRLRDKYTNSLSTC